ncbi:carboxymuconolactone decarboxylase family protein [Ralstonia solanacearum]|nr:carboxymuconolactone decarboxylase family protein [Ralstonia solanacearum OE1-1]AST88075.1 carboxymuconolactone decarboxylase family protein [Ralstonia pseudosolanacearum]AXV71045.1 carboxymuconolactone decarboxylase family protein [Ralstonia solanacearum]QUP60118.1 carboxymuconolactone decarboxylase family protein [Ralstonia nicotianae]AXV97454.1 carboxymuconolactone decarboxylase family protein [Ralstonia solanacearum]
MTWLAFLLREREVATIAALSALGNAAPQLGVHIEAGLNVGLTREEITEAILQMALHAGFPAALNGMSAAKAVFAAQDAAGVAGVDAAGPSVRRDTSN